MYRNLKFLSRVVLIFTVLCLFAVTNPIFAQDKAEKIDELMKIYYDYGQFNGTVLVAENGKVIYEKGFGLANMEWNIPNEPDTKFRLGSITKQFTAMLIMQLVEEKKIKLDKKITDYLVDYRKDTGDRITIHHLLTHTSGIPNYTNIPGFWQDSVRIHYPVDYVVKNFCSGDLEFEPGSTFNYSNSGYYILGYIIEKVTGKPYEQVLQERILKPLGMNNTGIDNHDVILGKRASGYGKDFEGYVNTPYFFMQNAYAAGAMYSTVEDMYLWDRALYMNKLLSRKYMKLMFKPHIPAFSGSYAYGWAVNNVPIGETGDSVKVIQHGGGINGFNTLIARLVDDTHLIVLLNNTERTRLNEMNLGITNILYNEPYDQPKKSLRDVLVKTILEKDVEFAIAEYHELKEKYPDDYDFTEIEMNLLGYQLLGMNKIEEAIEIFKLNIEVYPDASNVYDSMGEAYMIKGERELAIINYAKSLELNPNNTNAIEMLGRLAKE
ncbi:serine hydrolase [candidate division WOR-3 bacterium]|nr:serine hydrolase [candidate division WOR-3 bacterium]